MIFQSLYMILNMERMITVTIMKMVVFLKLVIFLEWQKK